MSYNRLLQRLKSRTNFLLIPKRKLFQNFFTKQSKRQQIEGVFVMFPDIPSDTPLTNELLNVPNGVMTTSFSKLNKENCVKAIAKSGIDLESCIGSIEQQLEEKKLLELSEFIEQIERKLVAFDYALSTLNILRNVNLEKFNFKNYESFYTSKHGVKSKRFKSVPIYEFMREIESNSKSLDSAQRRVVDKYLLEAKLNGLYLSSNSLYRFNDLKTEINKQITEYQKKLSLSTQRFRKTLDNPALIRVLPDELIAAIGSPEKSSSMFNTFMEYCPDRDMRQNLWNMYYSRSAPSLDVMTSNSIEIEKIRTHRKNMAKELGYGSFAQLSMQTKMAPNLQSVQNTISMLNSRMKNRFEADLAELTEFAKSSALFEVKNLELWDIPYWKRKFIISKYSIDDSAVRQYFPLPKVLNGLFEFANKLFGVRIEEVDPNQYDSYHKDVKLYRIILPDKGVIASFFFDPYARPNSKVLGSWFHTQTVRCESMSTQPVSHFILNLMPPLLSAVPSQLSFIQVLSLFQQFGYTLQASLNMMPYVEISGINNIEWDAIHMFSKFLMLWPLNSYDVIAGCSSHVTNNNQLPVEEFEKLRKAHQQFSCFNLKHELYKSALDLSLYTNDKFWREINKQVWDEYMAPFTMNPTEAHPCSFIEMFTDYSASYYSFIWAEMLAADVFSAFSPIDELSDESINKIGIRFRDTFLTIGGGCSSSEAFRLFMGRDPSHESFLKLNGVND